MVGRGQEIESVAKVTDVKEGISQLHIREILRQRWERDLPIFKFVDDKSLLVLQT